MKAKPILSTPVMKLDRLRDTGEWCYGHLGICAPQLRRLGLLPKPRPQAIRLHAFARAAKGRKPIRLALPFWQDPKWTSSATGRVRARLSPNCSHWLLTDPALSKRLFAGETVTLYVALEVVEGPAK